MNTIARMQWKPNREGGQQYGNLMIVNRTAVGTYPIYIFRDDMDDFANWHHLGTIGDGFLSHITTPEEFIDIELDTGYATLLTETEEWDSPRIVNWAKS
jgi:hypothetical protein